MPATDIDFEREFEELVRDLRALPTAAPQHVREHVRALGEPPRPRTLHDLLLFLSWRRSLLVLAPVGLPATDPDAGALSELRGLADGARQERRHAARPHISGDPDRALLRRLRRLGRRIDERRQRPVRPRVAYPGCPRRGGVLPARQARHGDRAAPFDPGSRSSGPVAAPADRPAEGTDREDRRDAQELVAPGGRAAPARAAA